MKGGQKEGRKKGRKKGRKEGRKEGKRREVPVVQAEGHPVTQQRVPLHLAQPDTYGDTDSGQHGGRRPGESAIE